DGFRVTLVDRLVCLPVGRLEVAKVLQVVKQRPDHFIGVAVVKLVPLGFGQTHRYNRVAGIARGFFEWSGGNFSRNSWPADPGPAALAQYRLDRRHQPARGRRNCPQVFGAGIKGKWQSVRNDDQAVHLARVKNSKSCTVTTEVNGSGPFNFRNVVTLLTAFVHKWIVRQ